MPSINVDIGGLGALARRLKGLQHEFEGMADVIGDYHDAVGDVRIADRLSDFAGNWSDKRREVSEKLGRVAEYAEAAAAAYAELERQIAGAANPAGQHGQR